MENKERKWKGTLEEAEFSTNPLFMTMPAKNAEAGTLWAGSSLVAHIDRSPGDEQALAHGYLFADALTTIQKCDLMPSELLSENDLLKDKINKIETKMTNTDVVKKLIGKTQPYGDSDIDRERFENLKEMCELVRDLIEEIKDAAREKDRFESSMREMGMYANKFLSQLEI